MFQDLKIKSPLNYIIAINLWVLVFIACNFALVALITATTDNYCMRNGVKLTDLETFYKDIVTAKALGCATTTTAAAV
jgi:hypothetical protein